jgi:hypothetical protein
VSANRAARFLVALAMALVVQGAGPFAAAQCFVAKVTPRDPQYQHYFGDALALDGDRALIAAPGDNDRGHFAGAAYLIVGLGGGTPFQLAKISPEDRQEEDLFSLSAVDLLGTTALIGESLDDNRGTWAGAAHVFVEQPGWWDWRVKLLAVDGRKDDRFGAATVLRESDAFIGAFLSAFAGATYVYARAGDTWQEFQKLTPTGATLNALFGERIAVDGDTLAGGAVFDSERGNLAGAVFVFERGGDGRWVQVAKLMADDGGENDTLGESVAIQGDTIVTGAHHHDGFGDNTGAAYIFRRDTEGVWRQVAKLSPPDAQPSDRMGYAVAMEGDLIAVGGLPSIDERGFLAGVVNLYKETEPGRWAHVGELAPAERNPLDQFGLSLALENGILLVGAPFTDGPAGEDSGAVYVYDLTRGPRGGLDGRGGDINKDGVTDLEDYKLFAACLTGPETPVPNLCRSARLDCDDDADLADFAILQQHLAGP